MPQYRPGEVGDDNGSQVLLQEHDEGGQREGRDQGNGSGTNDYLPPEMTGGPGSSLSSLLSTIRATADTAEAEHRADLDAIRVSLTALGTLVAEIQETGETITEALALATRPVVVARALDIALAATEALLEQAQQLAEECAAIGARSDAARTRLEARP
ncbi:MAG: hypothetical protein KGJ86_20555 [Chloroflexota bacterium]|nr:hypothetical protein [Chloroflexota bacterium]